MFRRPPLHYPDRPLHHFLQDAADRHPEKIALHFGDDVYTYRELDSTGNSFANALARARFRARHAGRARDHQSTGVDHRPARREPGRRRGRAAEPEWKAFGVRARVRAHAARRGGRRRRAGRGPRRGRRPRHPHLRRRPTSPPGWLSFWDLVYGTPGTRPAPLPDAALDARLSRTRSARARPDCPRRCGTRTGRWSRR